MMLCLISKNELIARALAESQQSLYLASTITDAHLAAGDLHNICEKENKPSHLRGMQSVYSALQKNGALQPVFLTQRFYVDARKQNSKKCIYTAYKSTLAVTGKFHQVEISRQDVEVLRGNFVDARNGLMLHEDIAQSLPEKDGSSCPLELEWLHLPTKDISIISIINDTALGDYSSEKSEGHDCSQSKPSSRDEKYFVSQNIDAVRQEEDPRTAITFEDYPIGVLLNNYEHFHCFKTDGAFRYHLIFDREFFGKEIRDLLRSAASSDPKMATSQSPGRSHAAEARLALFVSIAHRFGCSDN